MKCYFISDVHFPTFKTPKERWKWENRLKRMGTSEKYWKFIKRFCGNFGNLYGKDTR